MEILVVVCHPRSGPAQPATEIWEH